MIKDNFIVAILLLLLSSHAYSNTYPDKSTWGYINNFQSFYNDTPTTLGVTGVEHGIATDCDTFAVGFGASNDYIEIADNSALEFGTNSFSVEAWVKPEASATDDWRNIVSKKLSGGTTSGWTLRLNKGLKPVFFMGDGANRLDLNASDALTIGQWVHLAAVVNRETNTATLYVNGEVITSESAYALLSEMGSVSSYEVMRFGKGDDWMGDLDEVRIWNTAISQAEIKAKE